MNFFIIQKLFRHTSWVRLPRDDRDIQLLLTTIPLHRRKRGGESPPLLWQGWRCRQCTNEVRLLSSLQIL